MNLFTRIAASTALTIISGAALAADLPARVAPPPYVAPLPVFTWTGAYVGVNAGYVFDGGSSYEISGWRKSDSEIATFVFTSPPGSYAERTGRMANVGVIGVALFRERLPVLSYAPPITYSAPTAGAPTAQAGAPATPAPVPAPPARSSSARAAAPGAALAEINSSRQLVQQLGTGHGQREYSHVDHTEFARLQPQPNEIIRIRYDSLDNLVAMGIVPQPYRAPPSLNPFPGSGQPQYVPDPPG